MYFSVMTSTNVGAANAGNPTAVRTAFTFATAPVESPVLNFASARMSWFSAQVTSGWRKVKTRRTVVLITDAGQGGTGAGGGGTAGHPGGGGRTMTLF